MAASEAIRVDASEDLLPLSALLRQRGVRHRIFEDAGQQVLEVASADQAAQVRELHQRISTGELQIQLMKTTPQASSDLSPAFAPVTLVLIALSILGFLVFYLGAPLSWISALTYSPFEVVDGRPHFYSGEGQYWRLISPAFLHMGWLHIAFNALWTWELGRRVERVIGSVQFALLFVVMAVVSNVSQFVFSGPSLFGGLSGVVYGLLGFSWVAGRLRSDWQIAPSNGIVVFMVGWLVVCMMGLVELLGFGAIANAAHAGGLLSGLLLGAVLAKLAP